MSYLRVGAVVLLVCGSAATAAAEEYQVNLGPAARTNATRVLAVGRGAVKVSYNGKELSIDGTFGSLVSPATDAQLCQGAGIGVQGACGSALYETAFRGPERVLAAYLSSCVAQGRLKPHDAAVSARIILDVAISNPCIRGLTGFADAAESQLGQRASDHVVDMLEVLCGCRRPPGGA